MIGYLYAILYKYAQVLMEKNDSLQYKWMLKLTETIRITHSNLLDGTTVWENPKLSTRSIDTNIPLLRLLDPQLFDYYFAFPLCCDFFRGKKTNKKVKNSK